MTVQTIVQAIVDAITGFLGGFGESINTFFSDITPCATISSNSFRLTCPGVVMFAF